MRPSNGSIKLFGKNLKEDRMGILKRVGSLVETPSYYSHLTGYENLEAIRKILNVPKERINHVLQMVRLQNVANKKVKGYSLGMKQRLGIAASMLHDPDLLILDEPTNGLDPSGIIEMRKLIQSLPHEYNMTVVISSHLLSEIDQIATKVGILSNGKMIFQDSIETMRKFAKPSIQLKVNNNEAAWRALLENGQQANLTDDGISIHVQENDQVAETIKYLVQQGFSIYRVEEVKRSLENIFLEMTKEEQIV